jgi:hypothetical protein
MSFLKTTLTAAVFALVAVSAHAQTGSYAKQNARAQAYQAYASSAAWEQASGVTTDRAHTETVVGSGF